MCEKGGGGLASLMAAISEWVYRCLDLASILHEVHRHVNLCILSVGSDSEVLIKLQPRD